MNSKKILTVVKLNPKVGEYLDSEGYEVLDQGSIGEGRGIEVLMSSGKGRVPKDLLDRLPDLKMIDNFGVGYDGVDVQECRRRGIGICVTAGVLTDDVADLGVALALALCRKIPQSDAFVRCGSYGEGLKPRQGVKLSGKRAGIAGLGRIGHALARRLEGFSMSISYYDEHACDDKYQKQPDLATLASECDILFICAAATAQNRNMVDAKVLNALGPSGMLVNIARGSLVDEKALCDAVTSGAIAGAALDVYASEPQVPDALIVSDRTVLTPHIASNTKETRELMAQTVIANLKAFAERGELLNNALAPRR
ncbi:MAG: 2-hydroxyacid dehydrogenase [Succinivibrio sp.]